jgi:hypothetical protein
VSRNAPEGKISQLIDIPAESLNAQNLSGRKKTLSLTSLAVRAGKPPTGLSTGSVDDSQRSRASAAHFRFSYNPDFAFSRGLRAAHDSESRDLIIIWSLVG